MTLPTKIKRIVLSPDPRLNAPNADVTESWDELQPWVRLMWKAMRDTWTQGVGLAAPQVGWNVRLFVMNADTQNNLPQHRMVIWNPRMILTGQMQVMKEGCLSLPKCWAHIRRCKEVRLQAMSPSGPIDRIFTGLAAHAIQHEMDHLDGRLAVLDHLNDPVPQPVAGEGAPAMSSPPDTLPPPATDVLGLSGGLR